MHNIIIVLILYSLFNCKCEPLLHYPPDVHSGLPCIMYIVYSLHILIGIKLSIV